MTHTQRSMLRAAVALFVALGGFRAARDLGAWAQGSRGAETITERSIRSHLEFLASDALNGRGSGTRDEWIAAAYIASHFQRLGLEPFGDNGGYVQQIEMSGGVASAPPVLTAGTLTLTHGKEIVIAVP